MVRNKNCIRNQDPLCIMIICSYLFPCKKGLSTNVNNPIINRPLKQNLSYAFIIKCFNKSFKYPISKYKLCRVIINESLIQPDPCYEI